MTDRQDHKDRATEIVNEWFDGESQRTSVLVERIADALQSAHRAGKEALAAKDAELERVRGGPPCAACPVEVRDLAATAHNFLAAWDGDTVCRIHGKVESLRSSLARFTLILDRHFAGHRDAAEAGEVGGA